MGLVHRAGSGGEFSTFRRGKKRRRGLKVNFFPHPSSSGAEGASRGYQLGSAAGRKATRGWGAQGASVAVPARCGTSAGATPPTFLLPTVGCGETTVSPWGDGDTLCCPTAT